MLILNLVMSIVCGVICVVFIVWANVFVVEFASTSCQAKGDINRASVRWTLLSELSSIL